MACIFCDIINRKAPAYIIDEEVNHIAFLDKYPQMPGHVLVIPKQHIATWLDLDPQSLSDLMFFSQKIGKIMKLQLKPEVVIEKIVGIDITSHVHIHLLPLNAQNIENNTFEAIQATLCK